MDNLILILIIGGGLLVALIALVMLNRAWGDFPGPISGPRPSSSSRSLEELMRANARPPAAARDVVTMAGPEWGEEQAPPMPAGSGPSNLVPVSHPLLRQAVAAALERGGSPYALYFIRDGERIFLVPSRIADPQQRETVTRMFTALNSGGAESLEFGDIIRVLQSLGRR